MRAHDDEDGAIAIAYRHATIVVPPGPATTSMPFLIPLALSEQFEPRAVDCQMSGSGDWQGQPPNHRDSPMSVLVPDEALESKRRRSEDDRSGPSVARSSIGSTCRVYRRITYACTEPGCTSEIVAVTDGMP